ncbi:MAG: LemA family protein [bacterium]|nr:LemA family protein [bacterium]
MNDKNKETTGSKEFLKLYITCFIVFLITAVFLYSGYAGIKKSFVLVEQKRAQVINVMERQRAIQERYRGLPLTPAAEAELAGAENRIRVERQRYDNAVSAYNTKAGSFPGSIWSSILDLPKKHPLSHEVQTW